MSWCSNLIRGDMKIWKFIESIISGLQSVMQLLTAEFLLH